MFVLKQKRVGLFKKSLLFIAVPFLLVAPVASILSSLVIPSDTASAITQAEIEECIQKYDGKNITNPATNEGLQKCKELKVCTTKNVNDEFGSVNVTCTDPGGATSPVGDRVAKQEAILKRVYGEAIVGEFCKNRQGQEKAACTTEFRNASDTCLDAFFENGYEDNSNVVFPSIDTTTVARCVAQKTGANLGQVLNVYIKTQSTAVAEANKVPEVEAPEEGDESKSSCTIDGIGWIVCPIINFIAKINDAAYKGVSALLTVPPISTDTKSPLFSAWSIMRNFANVAFVIAFLYIIYSQITGLGVSNYGIKKLLPRIIIAAILVNISYWICAIAVDISNIVGSNIKSLFDGIISNLDDKDTYGNGGQSVGDQWTVGAGLILAATGAALFVTLSTFLPIAVTALAAVVTAVIVLVARQAIIILLIFISPLAFVAFLLPNTDQWFDRWRKTFFAMLLMFPVIALVFGASALASYVLADSAGGQISETSTISENSVNVLVQVAALGVALIPLFITPIIMKASTGVLGKIGAFVNNPNKGPFDKMRKRAEGYNERRKNLANARRLGGTNAFKMRADKLQQSDSRFKRVSGKALGVAASTGVVGTYAARRAEDSKRQNENARIASDAAAKSYYAKATQDEDYALKMAGGNEQMATLVRAYGDQAVKEEDLKDIKAERGLMAHEEDMGKLLTIMSTSSVGAKAAAAAAEVASRGSGEDAQAALDASRSISDTETRRMVQQQLISNMGSDQFGLGQGDKSALLAGNYSGKSYDERLNDRTEKKMSGDVIANLQPHDVAALERLARAGQLSDTALQNIADSVQSARNNPNLETKINSQEKRQAYDSILQNAAQKGITPQTQVSQPSSGSGADIRSAVAAAAATGSDGAAAQQSNVQSQPSQTSSTPAGAATNASTQPSTSIPVNTPSQSSGDNSGGGEIRIDHTSAENIAQAMDNSRNPTASTTNVTNNNSQTTNSNTVSNTTSSTNTTNTSAPKSAPGASSGQQNQPRVPENRDNSRMRQRDSGLYAPDDNNN